MIVPEAIESVIGQTCVPAEIIVVDDGSADCTAETLGGYRGQIIYVRQANAGLSAARNHGIAVSSQPLVAFLDDDDVWHPRKLELQMQCFGADPELSLVGAEQFDWPTRSFPHAPDSVAGLLRRVTWEQLVVRTLIPISSVLVRREALDRVGGFDESLRSSEDRDWFLRLAEVASIGMLGVPLSGYRDTPGSMCKDPAGRERAMRRILRGLNNRDAFRGRRLLGWKAQSYMYHTCAAARARAGDHVGAVVCAVKALAYYPLPYRVDEVRLRIERPKRLAVNLLRLFHVKGRDRGPTGDSPLAGNALRGAALS
jgi:glycosyltransferase involved in cell wall biosynthesis